MRNYKFLAIIILLFFNSFIIQKALINHSKSVDILSDETFSNINEAFNNSKIFLNDCLKGILIQDKINNISKNPKFSVVIPLYNSEKYISRAIISIQNQNMSDFEIILVNDFSSDNTLTIIEKIKTRDPRIKILNNKKNMGTLFSRSIGILSTKGKFILHLDSDDMFLNEDIFSTIFNLANKGNYDIMSYKAILSSYGSSILTNKIREYRFTSYNYTKVLHQPELGLLPLKIGKTFGSFLIKDSTLCNKCIKAKLYKKVLNKIGKERYSRYMILDEDRIVIYALYNMAESMKYIKKFAILIIPIIGSTSRKIHKISEILLYKLYFCDIAINFAKKTLENQRPIVYLLAYLLEKPALKKISELSIYNKKLIISCVNRILNYNYISNEDKNEILKRASKLEFLQFKKK